MVEISGYLVHFTNIKDNCIRIGHRVAVVIPIILNDLPVLDLRVVINPIIRPN